MCLLSRLMTMRCKFCTAVIGGGAHSENGTQTRLTEREIRCGSGVRRDIVCSAGAILFGEMHRILGTGVALSCMIFSLPGWMRDIAGVELVDCRGQRWGGQERARGRACTLADSFCACLDCAMQVAAMLIHKSPPSRQMASPIHLVSPAGFRYFSFLFIKVFSGL